MKKVGMIGLGNMGKGVCHSLIKAGYDMTVFDLSDTAKKQFEGQANIASSPKEVFEKSEITFLSLPNSDVVESTLDIFFQSGVKGKIVIDASTSNPISTRKLSARMAENGGILIDSPLTGSPSDAWDATMDIVVAGDEKTISENDALFKSFSRSYDYVGESGNAHLIKLAMNWANLLQAINYAQIFPVMEKLGIPSDKLYHIFDGPTLANWVFHFYGKKFVDRNYKMDFALALGYKDIKYMKMLCDNVNAPGYMLNGAIELCQEALDYGKAQDINPDMSYVCEAVYHAMEKQ